MAPWESPGRQSGDAIPFGQRRQTCFFETPAAGCLANLSLAPAKVPLVLSLPPHALASQFFFPIISHQQKQEISLLLLNQRSQRGSAEMSTSVSVKLFQYTSGRWL